MIGLAALITILTYPPGAVPIAWGSDGAVTWGTMSRGGGVPAWESDACWWGYDGHPRLVADDLPGGVIDAGDGLTWHPFAARAYDRVTGELVVDAVCLEWRDGGQAWKGPRWLLARVKVPDLQGRAVDFDRDGVVDIRDVVAFLAAWAGEAS